MSYAICWVVDLKEGEQSLDIQMFVDVKCQVGVQSGAQRAFCSEFHVASCCGCVDNGEKHMASTLHRFVHRGALCVAQLQLFCVVV